MKTIEQTHKELKELDDIIHYINNIVDKLCNIQHHDKLAADIKHAFNLESKNPKEIWLNTTWGLLSAFAHIAETREFTSLTKDLMLSMPVLDVQNIDDDALRAQLAIAFKRKGY